MKTIDKTKLNEMMVGGDTGINSISFNSTLGSGIREVRIIYTDGTSEDLEVTSITELPSESR